MNSNNKPRRSHLHLRVADSSVRTDSVRGFLLQFPIKCEIVAKNALLKKKKSFLEQVSFNKLSTDEPPREKELNFLGKSKNGLRKNFQLPEQNICPDFRSSSHIDCVSYYFDTKKVMILRSVSSS